MRSLHRAGTAAGTVALALGGVTAVAHADGWTTLYVNSSSAACSDTNGGTAAAQPFCTIQAAAKVVRTGYIVDIQAGDYAGPVTVSALGQGGTGIEFDAIGGPVVLTRTSGETGPDITVDGSSYVSFNGLIKTASSAFDASSVLVENSTGIRLDGLDVGSIEVDGTSSDVSVVSNRLSGGTGIKLDSGTSDDTVSGNWLDGGGESISADGIANSRITANTVTDDSGATAAISVSGASTGTVVKSNIFAYPGAGPAAEIAVDATAAPGTTEGYNVVWPHDASDQNATAAAYSWAGTNYSTAAAFTAATGQGQQDIIADPELTAGTPYTTDPTAPQINSAYYTDINFNEDPYGNAAAWDPAVGVAQSGVAVGARGAGQGVYTDTLNASATTVNALSVNLDTSLSQSVTFEGTTYAMAAAATPAVKYQVNWGDGHSAVYAAAGNSADTVLPHTYGEVGTYTITETADLTNGKTVTSSTTVSTAGSGYTAISPVRILDSRNGTGGLKSQLGVNICYPTKVAGVDGIPANATAVALNVTVTNTGGNGLIHFGSGSASNLNYNNGQTVANSAIEPIDGDGDVVVCNAGVNGAHTDVILDASGYFTRAAGQGFQSLTPERILDTRDGTGAAKAKVAAKHALTVQISGKDGIPSSVTAVAVHVTETNATGNGWIAAEANGAGVPTTSSLNYAAGQTISNTVIVPVSNGKIELYNGESSGSVDLIADVSGYFGGSGTEAFVPVTAFRAVDTRQTANGLASTGSESFALNQIMAEGSAGMPADATVAANLTATDETAGGSLTVWTAGTTRPNVSALNFGKGQNIATFGLFTATAATDSVSVYDNSPGSVQLVFDVFGYFSKS